MYKWLNNIHSRLHLTLMPPVCVLCGDPGTRDDYLPIDLCSPCQADLPRLVSACARCAEPLTGNLAMEALCGQCQINPPAFNRCMAMLAYHPPVDHLIQSVKFNNRLELAQLLGHLMGRWLSRVLDTKPDVLLPVPLHKHRLRERGFNQATEIAKPVARQLGCSLDITSCRRTRTTAPQSELSRKDRINNMRGAFEIMKPVTGHVAIIDDVMTTGSTAHELAKVLLKAGADSVDVWVCARA